MRQILFKIDSVRNLLYIVYDNESKETWKDFLNILKKQGLQGVLMFTTDAYGDIRSAIASVYNENLCLKKKIFKGSIYEKLYGLDVPVKLLEIAHEQLKLMAA